MKEKDYCFLQKCERCDQSYGQKNNGETKCRQCGSDLKAVAYVETLDGDEIEKYLGDENGWDWFMKAMKKMQEKSERDYEEN